MELVKIEWLDTQDYQNATWASTEEVVDFTKQFCTIYSVGWIVKKTRYYVSLCADFSPDPDTHGRVMKIPKKMIVKIEPLEVPIKDKSPAG